jgi:hypothetical protein
MKRFFGFMLLLSAFVMAGCADTVLTKTITTTTNPETGQVSTTEVAPVVTPGFFESGDYGKFLDFQKFKWASFERGTAKKTDAIIAAGAEAHKYYTTPTEHSQGDLITRMQLDRIPTAPPNDGIEPPKRFADLADRNLTSWVGMALQGWEVLGGSRANKNSDSSMHIQTGDNAPVFVGSNGNSMQDYKLATDAGGYISNINFNNGLDYKPISSETHTEGAKSYGLQLF